MKKLLAIAMVLCLLIPSATAEISDEEIEYFSIVASAFGLPDLYMKDATVVEVNTKYYYKFAIWNLDHCKISIGFDYSEKLKGGTIEGNGDDFLVASAALIATLDDSGKYNDYGRFFTTYLVSRVDEEEHVGFLENGVVYSVVKDGDNNTFRAVMQ